MKNSLAEQLSVMPLFWVSLAFLEGIVLASQLQPFTSDLWLGIAVAAAIVGVLLSRLRPQQVKLLAAVLPAFIFLGMARYQMIRPPAVTPGVIAYYNETPRNIYVTGTLAEPPDQRDTYLNLRIKVDAVDSGEGDYPVSGLLLVRLSNEYDLQYGQRIRLRGLVQTPPESEEFSYRDYLAMQGIHSILRTYSVTLMPFGEIKDPLGSLLFRLKNSLVKRVYTLFPDPEASLLAGILFGVDKNMPADLTQAFKNTGTAHIVAISGFNIAIIAAIFVTLFSRLFGKKIGALLAIFGITAYTILVGADASVVRAAIMGTLSILAGQFGRRNAALNTLALVAFLMAAYNPFILWDVGFQLSFAATLGLVLYAQRMQDAVAAFLARYLAPTVVEKIIGPFSDFFLLTLAAQLTTIPITAYHFGRISLVSFIANPFILPAQPPVMVIGGLAVLLSRLYMPLGQVIAWIAWPFVAYTIRMVEFFDKFPGGVWILGDFSLLFVILCYLVLFALTLSGPRLTKFMTPAIIVSALAVLTVLTWRTTLNQPDGRLHVTFLSVGSADAILIQNPAGRFLLINGGVSPSQLSNELGRRMPPFDRKLDYLVIASTQENQVAALPRTLERFPPANVLWAGIEQASFSSQKLDEWLTRYRIPRERARANSEIDLGQGAKLRVLAVSDRGAILAVEWGSFRVILPIGVNFDMYTGLKNGQSIGPVTALLLAESGYLPANPPAWLDNLHSPLVILSVAAGDPDGLPSRELLTALEKVTLARTDVNGWIDLSTDGKQVWFEVQKK